MDNAAFITIANWHHKIIHNAIYYMIYAIHNSYNSYIIPILYTKIHCKINSNDNH